MEKKERLFGIILLSCLLLGVITISYYLLNSRNLETTAKVENDQVVRFSAVGDILMEQGMYDWLGEDYQFHDLFDSIQPYLEADIMFMNQESIIGGKELGVVGTGYTFNAPEEIGEQLHDLGFNMISLANNHSYDMGLVGMDNSLSFWGQYDDIITSGMYDSQEDRERLRIIEKNGISFGLLAYTSFTNVILEEENEHRISYFTKQKGRHLTEERKATIKKEVKALRKKCDVLIVSCHWGDEFTYDTNSQQTDFADYLNELGVDVIIGQHPHVMQPIEWVENETTGHRTLVAYSLGNFLSADAIVNRASANTGNAYNLSSILTMNFVKKAGRDQVIIEDITYIPIVNHYEENYRNFHLYLVKDYNEDLAVKHYRNQYTANSFTKEWMIEEISSVMEVEGINVLLD